MKNNKKKMSLNLIWRLLIGISSVLLSILILLDPKLPQELEYFPIVPLLFGLLYTFSNKVSKNLKNNLGLLGLNVMLIVRYFITSFLMWLQGYEVGRGVLPSIDNFEVAVLIMILEMIVIFGIIEFLHRRFYSNSSNSSTEVQFNKNFVGTIFLLICLGITIIYPQVLNNYSFVFTTVEYQKNPILNMPFGSLLPLIVQFGIMYLTISIINWNYKKYKQNKSPILVYFSIFIVFLSSSFILGNSRLGILIPMITGMFLLNRIFPEYSKKIYSLFGIFAAIILTISTMVKQFKVESIDQLNIGLSAFNESSASLFQSYFSGVHNIAIAVKARELFKLDIDLETILSDLFSSVMLLSDFFYSNFGAVNMFNYSFYNSSISTDQILPMLGQGYLYFGFIFSPVFSALVVLFMMYFDKKCRESKTVFEVYIYAYIAIRFGFYFMSNAVILVSFFTNYFLLLLLLILINKKIVFSSKVKAKKSLSPNL
ncbi:hypothetical protein ACWNS2_07450 [Planococcus plakortidis]